jgi:hypothetical protein
MKKSELLTIAVQNHLSKEPTKFGDRRSVYLCVAVMKAVTENQNFFRIQSSYEAEIHKDITKEINGCNTVESYLYRQGGKTYEMVEKEAYNFRIQLANKLINRYKEEEKWNLKNLYMKLSKAYKQLKETLKSKLS